MRRWDEVFEAARWAEGVRCRNGVLLEVLDGFTEGFRERDEIAGSGEVADSVASSLGLRPQETEDFREEIMGAV